MNYAAVMRVIPKEGIGRTRQFTENVEAKDEAEAIRVAMAKHENGANLYVACIRVAPMESA